MQHSPLTESFTLGPPASEAPVCVLLLHGFTGSPWEVRPFGEAMAARGFHVHAPRLPGHGTIPHEMESVDAEQWRQASRAALVTVSQAKPVVVVGFSMGALLALLLASESPRRVSGLILLAPALRLKSPVARLLRRMPFALQSMLATRWIEKDGIDCSEPEAQREAPLLKRYPAARLLDLFALQRQARAVINNLTLPVLTLHAVNDHVVSFRGVQELGLAMPQMQTRVLQRGFHIMCRDVDRATAVTHAADFIDAMPMSVELH